MAEAVVCGLSATIASVVTSSPATEAEPCKCQQDELGGVDFGLHHFRELSLLGDE
jgi:hypothetical protein